MSKREFGYYEGAPSADYIRQRTDSLSYPFVPPNLQMEPALVSQPEPGGMDPALILPPLILPSLKRVYKKKVYRKRASVSYMDFLSPGPRRAKRSFKKKKSYVKSRKTFKPVRRARRVSGSYARASCSCGHSSARKSYKSFSRRRPSKRT